MLTEYEQAKAPIVAHLPLKSKSRNFRYRLHVQMKPSKHMLGNVKLFLFYAFLYAFLS
jgi:hypothetical protein